MGMGSDTENDATPDNKDDQKAAVEQVMRLEFANACRDAHNEAETLMRDDFFITSDINAVFALAQTKAQIRYKKRILEDLDEEKENAPEAKTTMQKELDTLKDTAAKQTRVLVKAKRVKILRDRKRELESAKRNAETQKSHTSSLSPSSKKQRTGLDAMAASPPNSESSSANPMLEAHIRFSRPQQCD